MIGIFLSCARSRMALTFAPNSGPSTTLALSLAAIGVYGVIFYSVVNFIFDH